MDNYTQLKQKIIDTIYKDSKDLNSLLEILDWASNRVEKAIKEEGEDKIINY